MMCERWACSFLSLSFIFGMLKTMPRQQQQQQRKIIRFCDKNLIFFFFAHRMGFSEFVAAKKVQVSVQKNWRFKCDVKSSCRLQRRTGTNKWPLKIKPHEWPFSVAFVHHTQTQAARNCSVLYRHLRFLLSQKNLLAFSVFFVLFLCWKSFTNKGLSEKRPFEWFLDRWFCIPIFSFDKYLLYIVIRLACRLVCSFCL